jgi:hypothetical protein
MSEYTRDDVISTDARRRKERTWISVAVIIEVIGLAIDAVWHGLLSAEVEPQTYGEMVRHLLTVHLVLYVGVGTLFVSTAWAARRSGAGAEPPIAFAGAAVQLIGEAWHAYSHLQLRPSPLPELIGFVGLAVAIGATAVSGRGTRGVAMEPGRAPRSR